MKPCSVTTASPDGEHRAWTLVLDANLEVCGAVQGLILHLSTPTPTPHNKKDGVDKPVCKAEWEWSCPSLPRRSSAKLLLPCLLPGMACASVLPRQPSSNLCTRRNGAAQTKSLLQIYPWHEQSLSQLVNSCGLEGDKVCCWKKQ